MKNRIALKIIGCVLVMTSLTACNSAKDTSSNTQSGQRGQGRPTATQLLSEMDANKDGKLSKEEAKGPLAQDFAKIDTDDDGFISKEELENAPQPQRGGQQGGQRGGRGK
ncbi:EF-hand domain-containing protein [Leeuwenhoekiella sp. NPDC079379]|uniref:EF-hand domain-containing protein n=1 Tax=Leeuwenhoekiella sp. NPDC079379 TaxID=3364122 RepID=UPI0037C919F3